MTWDGFLFTWKAAVFGLASLPVEGSVAHHMDSLPIPALLAALNVFMITLWITWGFVLMPDK